MSNSFSKIHRPWEVDWRTVRVRYVRLSPGFIGSFGVKRYRVGGGCISAGGLRVILSVREMTLSGEMIAASKAVERAKKLDPDWGMKERGTIPRKRERES